MMGQSGFSAIADEVADAGKSLAGCSNEVRERWDDPVFHRLQKIAIQPLMDEGRLFIGALLQAEELVSRALRQLEE